MGKTVNRGQLLRWAKQGMILGAVDFYFGADEITQESFNEKDPGWKPVKVIANNDEWEEGKYNLRESSFRSTSGTAYANNDGTYTLIIHSNNSVRLKKK